jgi:nitroreductase
MPKLAPPGRLGAEETRILLAAAIRAPSMLNTQPWRFRVHGNVIELRADRRRSLPVADPHGRALCVGCGAALLNLRLAAAHLGRGAVVRLLPDRAEPTWLAMVRLNGPHRAGPNESELYAAIPHRRSDRHPFRDHPLPPAVATELVAAARVDGATLSMLDQPAAHEVLALARRANLAWAADPSYQAELAGWVAHDGRRRDGVPATARGPRDATGLLALPDVSGVARDSLRPAARFEQRPHLAVLSTRHDSVADWLRAGQALQRVLLTATARGLATTLLSTPIERPDLRPSLRAVCAGELPQMVIRLGSRPAARAAPLTPRRSVAEIAEAAGAMEPL